VRCFFFTNEKCKQMMRWISLINKLFSDKHFKGNVATRLRCGGISRTLHYKFSGDYNGERILKIGQYLTKLCVEHLGFTFLAHFVYPILSSAQTSTGRRRKALRCHLQVKSTQEPSRRSCSCAPLCINDVPYTRA